MYNIALRILYIELSVAYLEFFHSFVMDYLKYWALGKQMASQNMLPFKIPGPAFV